MVEVDTCTNDSTIINMDPLSNIPNENIIQLWDKSCFDINELVRFILANDGANRNPIHIGESKPIWREGKQEDLENILNHPKLKLGLKVKFQQILSERMENTIFIKCPKLLYFIAECGIQILSDYTEDYTYSVSVLGILNETIQSLNPRLQNELRKIINKDGKTLEDTLQCAQDQVTCIHGIGYQLISLYCNNLIQNKDRIDISVMQHPGVINLEENIYIFGYFPLNQHEKIWVGVYQPEVQQALPAGGSGRIGYINLYPCIDCFDIITISDSTFFKEEGDTINYGEKIKLKLETTYRGKLKNFIDYYKSRTDLGNSNMKIEGILEGYECLDEDEKLMKEQKEEEEIKDWMKDVVKREIIEEEILVEAEDNLPHKVFDFIELVVENKKTYGIRIYTKSNIISAYMYEPGRDKNLTEKNFKPIMLHAVNPDFVNVLKKGLFPNNSNFVKRLKSSNRIQKYEDYKKLEKLCIKNIQTEELKSLTPEGRVDYLKKMGTLRANDILSKLTLEERNRILEGMTPKMNKEAFGKPEPWDFIVNSKGIYGIITKVQSDEVIYGYLYEGDINSDIMLKKFNSYAINANFVTVLKKGKPPEVWDGEGYVVDVEMIKRITNNHTKPSDINQILEKFKVHLYSTINTKLWVNKFSKKGLRSILIQWGIEFDNDIIELDTENIFYLVYLAKLEVNELKDFLIRFDFNMGRREDLRDFDFVNIKGTNNNGIIIRNKFLLVDIFIFDVVKGEYDIQTFTVNEIRFIKRGVVPEVNALSSFYNLVYNINKIEININKQLLELGSIYREPLISLYNIYSAIVEPGDLVVWYNDPSLLKNVKGEIGELISKNSSWPEEEDSEEYMEDEENVSDLTLLMKKETAATESFEILYNIYIEKLIKGKGLDENINHHITFYKKPSIQERVTNIEKDYFDNVKDKETLQTRVKYLLDDGEFYRYKHPNINYFLGYIEEKVLYGKTYAGNYYFSPFSFVKNNNGEYGIVTGDLIVNDNVIINVISKDSNGIAKKDKYNIDDLTLIAKGLNSFADNNWDEDSRDIDEGKYLSLIQIYKDAYKLFKKNEIEVKKENRLLFNKFDEDGDNLLSRKEFITNVIRNYKITKNDAENLFVNLDTDGDDFISLEEFIFFQEKLEELKTSLRMLTPEPIMNKPQISNTILVIEAVADHNETFQAGEPELYKIFAGLKNFTFSGVDRVSDINDIRKLLSSFPPGQKIAHLIIRGHGNISGIVLSNSYTLSIQHGLDEFIEILKPKMADGASILLHSCCVGRGGMERDNFANRLSFGLKDTLVYGSDKPISPKDLEVIQLNLEDNSRGALNIDYQITPPPWRSGDDAERERDGVWIKCTVKNVEPDGSLLVEYPAEEGGGKELITDLTNIRHLVTDYQLYKFFYSVGEGYKGRSLGAGKNTKKKRIKKFIKKSKKYKFSKKCQSVKKNKRIKKSKKK